MSDNNTPDGIEVRVNGSRVIAFRDGSISRMVDGKWKPKVFGSPHGPGYRRARIGGRSFYVHRVVADAFVDGFSICGGDCIDHINGDRADNRPENLRVSSVRENALSFNEMRGGSSRFRGVYWYKPLGKWKSQAMLNGRKTHIGYFDHEEAAAIAFDRRARRAGYNQEALNLYQYPELATLAAI